MADRGHRRGPLPPAPRPWPHGGVRTRINAVAFRVASLGVRHAVRRLPEVLSEDETVEMLATGTHGHGTGVLVMTDRRLVLYGHGMLTRTVEEFPYDRISSVQWTGGLLMGTLRVVAAGGGTELRQVPTDQGTALADLLGHRLAAGAPPPPGTAGHIAARLATLDDLRASGAITDQEHRDRRAEILRAL
ncbi:PH domain-containing protein [Streptomyces sp. SS1-1]|uniref:PH domain-containing protein n=1 Tax=Streptomyces sp. SS1-1 TaxID=2651869 RepID=UPI001250CE34|nr:PH domain-containing protein [Streptomyces sp. SS1-1]KAB2976584.1 PH domain-containing protein [Streptomyces sp. SS1-1]